MKREPKIMWCEHCNAMISYAGIRACLRRPCHTQPLLEEKAKRK